MVKTLAVGASALAIAGVATGVVVSGSDSTSSTTTTVSIPAPQNLRVIEVGPDHVKVSYGPSIAGKFSHDVPAPNGRSMVVRWGAAMDDLYPTGITYTFYKNGKLIWANRAQTWANVGFTTAVRSFQTCVVPHSQNGFGPKRCVTWTAP